MRLAEKHQHSTLCILIDKLLHYSIIQAARLRHTMYLICSTRGADVWIEAAARCCNQVHRDGGSVVRIGGVQCLNRCPDCAIWTDQGWVKRSVVGASRTRDLV